MKKYILFLMITLFTLNYNVEAKCSSSDISRLRLLVSNVNISYDYHMEYNIPYFDLTINNITPDMYFYDSVTRRNYTYNDTNNGEITIYGYRAKEGILKFYSNINECHGMSLGTKYYEFPKYNYYYTNELCSGMQNLSLCQKWVNINYTYSEFEKLIFEYKNKVPEEEVSVEIQYNKTMFDKIVKFYVDYYYIILGIIILVCSAVIFVKSRNNKFNL